jgi:hypothetical protein
LDAGDGRARLGLSALLDLGFPVGATLQRLDVYPRSARHADAPVRDTDMPLPDLTPVI